MKKIVINAFIQRLELFLGQIIQDAVIPANTIRQAIHYSLFPGGKRLRPAFVYLSGVILETDLKVLDVIAAAIELTHCYSLVHDDLPAMDNDDFRRGKPSCHKAFDEATAILTGDGMQALAIEILVTHLTPLLKPAQILKIIKELVLASGINGMVSGQSLDLSELTCTSITEAQIREIHWLKTGRLILACFEMVMAAHSRLDAASRKALEDYARHTGLVFQMQDDYLDYYAPAHILGKGRSSDTANEKTTFATLLTRQQLEEQITQQYQLAIDALTIFGQKAAPLIALTQTLQTRSHF